MVPLITEQAGEHNNPKRATRKRSSEADISAIAARLLPCHQYGKRNFIVMRTNVGCMNVDLDRLCFEHLQSDNEVAPESHHLVPFLQEYFRSKVLAGRCSTTLSQNKAKSIRRVLPQSQCKGGPICWNRTKRVAVRWKHKAVLRITWYILWRWEISRNHV